MVICLIILGFILPIITGLLAYLQNKNIEIKRLETIMEERKPPNTKETPKETPYNLPVTERNKIIKEYTSLNLNLSQELLSSYSSSENKYYAIISMSYLFLSCTKKKNT